MNHQKLSTLFVPRRMHWHFVFVLTLLSCFSALPVAAQEKQQSKTPRRIEVPRASRGAGDIQIRLKRPDGTVVWIKKGKAIKLQPPPRNEQEQAELLRLLKLFVDELVPITPGKGKFPKSFQMGSATGEPSEQPVHTVTLQQDFWISKYEVPQNLYEVIMGRNPSRWKGPRNSVEMMNWASANTFCEMLTLYLRLHKLIGDDEEIRLPTEAEWEYCCRAGTQTAYSFGDTAQKSGDKGKEASILDEYAWHTGNAAGNDPPVGALKPNLWGLYDMHGYLWEFVADPWHEDYKNAPTDGSVWKVETENPSHVARGGAWTDRYDRLRSAFRVKVTPETTSPALGLRCVKARIAKVKKSEN